MWTDDNRRTTCPDCGLPADGPCYCTDELRLEAERRDAEDERDIDLAERLDPEERNGATRPVLAKATE